MHSKYTHADIHVRPNTHSYTQTTTFKTFRGKEMGALKSLPTVNRRYIGLDFNGFDVIGIVKYHWFLF